jgi:nitrogen regulatory protein PII
MEAVKRVEVVVESVEVRRVTEALETLGVSGYTVIPAASGRGERGSRDGDGVSGVFANTYVLTACPPEQLEAVIEAVRPLLRETGGICLVSDAQWVRH